MTPWRTLVWWAIASPVALWLSVALAGCGSDDDRAGGADGGASADTILVFAAASLTDAFADIADAFEAAHPGASVELNLAGSSSLREQVLAGAPADVFAAADPAIVDELIDAGEVDDEPTVFATNRLAIAVPVGNPGAVAGLADFGNPELLIGLCAEPVPCGSLAREALASAGVEPAVDTEEPDVRALLTKIEAGELDAALVYRSDVATAADRVEGIELGSDGGPVASYPIAVLAGADDPVLADAFVAFVLGDEGRAILARHGFGPP